MAGYRCNGVINNPVNLEITQLCIEDLLRKFISVPYNVLDPHNVKWMQQCLWLFEKDYMIATVDNTDGRLCAHYPPTIIIIQAEHPSQLNTIQNTETNECLSNDSTYNDDQITAQGIVSNCDNSEEDYLSFLLSSSEIFTSTFDSLNVKTPDRTESAERSDTPEAEHYPSKIDHISVKYEAVTTNGRNQQMVDQYDIINEDELQNHSLLEQAQLNLATTSNGDDVMDIQMNSHVSLLNGNNNSPINGHTLSEDYFELIDNDSPYKSVLESSVNKNQVSK